MKQVLEGALLARMMIHASASLNTQKQKINELNVFPVPDGDTGTNMSLTIGSAAAELRKKNPDTVSEAASIAASAMLRGARGNSGVILSLLFRGFSKTVKDQEKIDGVLLAEAFNAGVAAAYKAVMKPAEGTVLTVSRLAAARATEAAGENSAVEFVLEQSIFAAEEALANTIEQNPVLKKAGVVDAGGMGYLRILQGMLDELRGLPMPEGGDEALPAKEQANFGAFSTEEITYGYCTEFICSRDNDKDPGKLRSFLDGMGDSLVLVEDDEIIKVHVHTNHPGKVLEEALAYGALLTVKIENMREQHTEILEAEVHAQEPEEDVIAPPEKKYGFVAVCAGEGLAKVFEELGADGIIRGGQTMNPSTEDILREINKTPAEIVYVLPNNGNIIMAAQQAVPLVEGKRVVVLPSRTVPQGMAAMLQMDYDGEEADNTATMEEVMAQVTTMEVTYAARDSEFDGTIIKEGDYLALLNNQLFGTNESLESLLKQMAEETARRGSEFITVFYGQGVAQEEAEAAAGKFRSACPDAEVTVLNGGQPVYLYLVSAE
ncbi:MAG: Dihydroxyacetone kinase family protein [Firmicutes bacterium]|nr:Dihydroxyacetone kinase family protein [Bacillota bacterium]